MKKEEEKTEVQWITKEGIMSKEEVKEEVQLQYEEDKEWKGDGVPVEVRRCPGERAVDFLT